MDIKNLFLINNNYYFIVRNRIGEKNILNNVPEEITGFSILHRLLSIGLLEK